MRFLVVYSTYMAAVGVVCVCVSVCECECECTGSCCLFVVCFVFSFCNDCRKYRLLKHPRYFKCWSLNCSKTENIQRGVCDKLLWVLYRDCYWLVKDAGCNKLYRKMRPNINVIIRHYFCVYISRRCFTWRKKYCCADKKPSLSLNTSSHSTKESKH
jgi:hypothetical protein